MEEKYPFQEIELKWQRYWEENKLYEVQESTEKKKFYVLEMFPYTSAQIHMGHVRNYSIGDVVARYKRMQGYAVLHPMGFDSFGMPAEKAAIERKIDPRTWTYRCIENIRRQLKRLGFSYDWTREVITCDPNYYRWNQWFFLKLYERGLVYKKLASVNWCPDCLTVLADEQVEAGRCWRCQTIVEQKELEQWFFKITNYADRLLEDLSLLSGWAERPKVLQRNWIGKSVGATIDFPLISLSDSTQKETAIKVFTTRPDTIFGATYMVLAPEHPLLSELIKNGKASSELLLFLESIKKQNRTVEAVSILEKEGVFTGLYAINPATKEKIPVWVANYVLMEYGTGAIMAVPAHDQRDFEFAKKYNLPIRIVIQSPDYSLDEKTITSAYEADGIMVNSGPFNGLNSAEAKEKMVAWMEKEGFGAKAIHYRMRDWNISRQRYWGTPIPIIYCDKCGIVPVPEKDLPVLLPEKVFVTNQSVSPLTKIPEFVNCTCPKCHQPAKRETDTMDGFVDSSWYFLRYCGIDKENKLPFDLEAAKYWMPADLYVGGIEHATKHLIYARFFTKFLKDEGYIDVDEPFITLLNQGMVLKDGAKMSKSKGNVVDPDEMVEKYGADVLRLFMLFAAPPEPDLEWSDEGIEGANRFINRVWRIVNQFIPLIKNAPQLSSFKIESISPASMRLRRMTHLTIKKVTQDIEDRFHFNTAIASLMEFTNELYRYNVSQIPLEEASAILKESVTALILLLAPFVPHLAEELWHRLGYKDSVVIQNWPKYNPELIKAEELTIVIQVNGKVRSRITVPVDISESELKEKVLANPQVKKWIDNKTIKNIVIVPNKLVNIVV